MIINKWDKYLEKKMYLQMLKQKTSMTLILLQTRKKLRTPIMQKIVKSAKNKKRKFFLARKERFLKRWFRRLGNTRGVRRMKYKKWKDFALVIKSNRFLDNYKIKKEKLIRPYAIKNDFNRVMLRYHLQVLRNKRYKLYVYSRFLKRFHLRSSASRLVNLCTKTGRSHFVLRRFRFSRMTFKEYADKGYFTGVRRSSW